MAENKSDKSKDNVQLNRKYVMDLKDQCELQVLVSEMCSIILSKIYFPNNTSSI